MVDYYKKFNKRFITKLIKSTTKIKIRPKLILSIEYIYVFLIITEIDDAKRAHFQIS
jgi:hypothetical protein